MSEKNLSVGINRRTVLKKVAAGATISAGFAGNATATQRRGPSEQEIREATTGYRNIESVRKAFANRPALLETIADAGLIEEASIDAIGIVNEPAKNGQSPEGIVYDAQPTEDGATPEIRVSRKFDDGLLVMAVRPEISDDYAALIPPGVEDDDDVIMLSEPAPKATMCGGCPDNKCCTETCGFCNCGCDPCPSCTCCYCCNWNCKCCECGLNCVFECP
ncbi:hypothetical protein [Halocatena halophila]|uniref:hypothetical protein n=1 Tax=Halocatena halophila TaxID=2814576 RepID=UPI002ED3FABA